MKTFKSIIQEIQDKNLRTGETGWWLTPKGVEISIGTHTHIFDIITNPKKYGLTSEKILDIHKKHGEEKILGAEGKAREEIMVDLLKKGWIRIRRKLIGRAFSVTIQLIKFNKSVEKDVFKFLEKQNKFDPFVIEILSSDGRRIVSKINEEHKPIGEFLESYAREGGQLQILLCTEKS